MAHLTSKYTNEVYELHNPTEENKHKGNPSNLITFQVFKYMLMMK